jgi:hypothetical protein
MACLYDGAKNVYHMLVSLVRVQLVITCSIITTETFRNRKLTQLLIQEMVVLIFIILTGLVPCWGSWLRSMRLLISS